MDWTQENLERILTRLNAYRENPEILTSIEREKCRQFYEQVKRDQQYVEACLALGGKAIEYMQAENPAREELVRWLAEES